MLSKGKKKERKKEDGSLSSASSIRFSAPLLLTKMFCLRLCRVNKWPATILGVLGSLTVLTRVAAACQPTAGPGNLDWGC